MSATYPDLDVTDPQEPVYDDKNEILDSDPAFIEFLKARESEEVNVQEELCQ